MRQFRSNDWQKMSGYSSLSSLSLPGPAVIIDMRRPVPQDRPLLENIATEIEDLTTAIWSQRVSRWRYLSQWIEFITLKPFPSGETIYTASSFTLVDRKNMTITFATKEQLVEYTYREYVNQVRTRRNNASRDMDVLSETLAETSPEKENTTVRVFFLIDLASPQTFHSATRFAAMLRQQSHLYGNQQRSERGESISPIAICMNTEKTQRHQATQRGQLKPSERIPTPFFDMLILVHSYDDNQGFVNRQERLYELELLLYTLLLSSENLIADKREMRDEDARSYLTVLNDAEEESNHFLFEEESELELAVRPSPISPILCVFGTSSFEYSARCGLRWLDYGLSKEVLATLSTLQPGTPAGGLQLPDGRDWLESWWSEFKEVAPQAIFPHIQELKSLVEFSRHVNRSPTQGIPLRDSHQALLDFCEQTEQYYKTSQPLLQSALGATEQIASVLQVAAQNYQQNATQPASSNATGSQALANLQIRARSFSSTLFRGSAGAIPRAIDQISELEVRINREEIGTLAQNVPNLFHYLNTFEEAAKGAQSRLRQLIKIWKLPILGNIQRSTLLALLAVVLTILLIWLLQGNIHSMPGTDSLLVGFPGLSPFIIGCCIVAAGVLLFYLSRRDSHLYRQREEIVNSLRAVATFHLGEIRSTIAAKTALILLQEAGLYRPDGRIGPYKQKLRLLQKALIEAQQHAQEEQREAYERLKPPVAVHSPAQPDRNSRKDLLSWDDILETFQSLKMKYTTNNPSLEQLAASLLRCMEEDGPSQKRDAALIRPESRQKQLQQSGTELAAVLLLVLANDLRITAFHPLIERYRMLDDPSLRTFSTLGKHIDDLYNLVKARQQEQIMSGSTRDDASYDQEAWPAITIDQLIVAWIELLQAGETETAIASREDSVISRLDHLQIKPPNALESLRSRCKPLGTLRETFESDHFYFLLAPKTFNEVLYDTLLSLPSAQTRLISFPDQEKLVYLHMYFQRLKADYNIFSV